jgi:hypothetical protein
MRLDFVQVVATECLRLTSAKIENEAANPALAPAPDQAHHDSLNDQFLGGD